MTNRQAVFEAVIIGIMARKLPTHEKLKNIREREAGNRLPSNSE